MSALSNFKQGDAVRLKDTVRHAEYRGMCGTVVRVVKSRGVVTIKGDSGKKYGALPENVELIENVGEI